VGKTSFPKQNSSTRSSRTFLAVEGRGEVGMRVDVLVRLELAMKLKFEK
jgi:hypothetical protein